MAHAAAVMWVDLQALTANWCDLARRVAPARCSAVVAADAYGLGAAPVVRALLQAGCREFFTGSVDEGIALREALADAWPTDARLHLLHGARPGAERDSLAHDLVPVIGSLEALARWQALARQLGRSLPAALFIDTGVLRHGLPPAALAGWGAGADGPAGIAPTLVMSELLCGDDPQDPALRRQLERFDTWRQRWPSAWGCLAGSAGIFCGPEFHFDLVRPGSALYGAAPFPGLPRLRPVVRLEGHLHVTSDPLAQQPAAAAFEILTRLGASCERRYLDATPP